MEFMWQICACKALGETLSSPANDIVDGGGVKNILCLDEIKVSRRLKTRRYTQNKIKEKQMIHEQNSKP